MPKKEIGKLMLVIGCGVIAAFLLTYLMIANYGPTGQYVVSNILIEPTLAEKISYRNNEHYSFDRFELVYYDNRWETLKLTEQQYNEIYQLLKGDKSISSDEQNIFYTTTPASLTIVAHSDNREKNQAFQEIQFAEHGDYYRIRLPREVSPANWIYFKHPRVFEQIKKIIK